MQLEKFLRGINQALDINLAIPRGLRHRFCLEFGEGETPLPRYLERARDAKRLIIDEWPAISESDVEAFNAAEIGDRIRWKRTFEQTAWVGERKSEVAAQRARKKSEARDAMLYRVQEFLGIRERSGTARPIVFVCADIEAIEVAPNPVSEIGIAILDTEDIQGVESGPIGKTWREHIRAYHLRTKEYAGLVNYRYVQGCPDAFNFG